MLLDVTSECQGFKQVSSEMGSQIAESHVYSQTTLSQSTKYWLPVPTDENGFWNTAGLARLGRAACPTGFHQGSQNTP